MAEPALVKRGRGRPSKLTPEVSQRIVQAIRAGNYIETAAAYAGINKTTLYDWLKQGARELDRVQAKSGRRIREKARKYVDFSNSVKKALAEAEVSDVAQISLAVRAGNWQAAAWRLERKHFERWGRKQYVESKTEVRVSLADLVNASLDPALASTPDDLAGAGDDTSGVGELEDLPEVPGPDDEQ
jgi:transposase-like protein